MAGNKKCVLTLEQKIEIIERLKKGKSLRAVAQEFDISTRTVYRIKQNSAKYETFCNDYKKLNGNIKKRRMVVPCTDEKFDSAVYEWFLQQRKQGIPVIGPLLCEKALEINKQLGGNPDFKASNGWLRNFKNRHGIRQIQDEEFSADIEEFRREMESRGLICEQLYNCDEIGLYWRALPDKTLAPNYKVTKID